MTFTKPVRLQKATEFELLVKKHFPHIEWEFSSSSLTAMCLRDGGIIIKATRKYIGKGKEPDSLCEWNIDCSPGGRGRTIEESIMDWKASIIDKIAHIYLPKYDFQRKEIKDATEGKKRLPRVKPLEESLKWVLFCSRMELGKDVPVPIDPYADLRE